MSELIYPTRTKIGGPILISAASLEQLDGILAEQIGLLRDLRRQTIEDEVAQRLALMEGRPEKELENARTRELEFAERLHKDSLKLTLYFSDGSRLSASSFEDAATHTEASQVLAKGFDLSAECGAVSFRLSADSDSYSTELTLEVSPSGSEAAKGLFAALRRWMRTIQAPRWQQWWCTLGHPFFVLYAFLTVVFVVWAIPKGNPDSQYYKQQAQQLVKRGVGPDTQQKALELLLALEAGSSAPIEHKPDSPGVWFWFFVIGGVIVCLIISYPPKLVLGLGLGEDRIKYWRTWIRFVFVIVPGFIGTNVLWPFIAENVKRLTSR